MPSRVGLRATACFSHMGSSYAEGEFQRDGRRGAKTESQRNGKWAAGGPAEGERQAGEQLAGCGGSARCVLLAPPVVGTSRLGNPVNLLGRRQQTHTQGP